MPSGQPGADRIAFHIGANGSRWDRGDRRFRGSFRVEVACRPRSVRSSSCETRLAVASWTTDTGRDLEPVTLPRSAASYLLCPPHAGDGDRLWSSRLGGPPPAWSRSRAARSRGPAASRPSAPNPSQPHLDRDRCPAGERARVTVLNVLGAALDFRRFGGGTAGVQLLDGKDAEGRRLPAGVYFLQVEAARLAGDDKVLMRTLAGAGGASAGRGAAGHEGRASEADHRVSSSRTSRGSTGPLSISWRGRVTRRGR